MKLRDRNRQICIERIERAEPQRAPGALDRMTWMAEAGFRNTRVESLVGGQSMVVGMK
jgi:hypothetical protein